MSKWWTDLAATRSEVWRLLGRGTKDRKSAARFPVLATVGQSGGAEARTVVLRRADPERAEVEVYTDLASAKVRELKVEPRAALVVWDARAHLQIRLRATAQILSGAAVSAIWEALPEAARSDYGGAAPPGSAVALPQDARPFGQADRFAVLRFSVAEIETLHLGADAHRRALFWREDDWKGTWLAP